MLSTMSLFISHIVFTNIMTIKKISYSVRDEYRMILSGPLIRQRYIRLRAVSNRNGSQLKFPLIMY